MTEGYTRGAVVAHADLPVVLVVDDDEATRQLVGEDLAGHVARLLAATDLETGVALARRDSPDVVVLDIRLPRRPRVPAEDCGLDGIRELRAAAGGAPVIIVS